MFEPHKFDLASNDVEEGFNWMTQMMVAMDPVCDSILEQIMFDVSGMTVTTCRVAVRVRRTVFQQCGRG